MKKIFKKEEIFAKRGCYGRRDVENLSFINKEKILLIDILKSEIDPNDKRWFLYNKCDLTSDQKLKLALKILSIFKEKYPNDIIIESCLVSINDFINNNITEIALIEKRNILLKEYIKHSLFLTDALIDIINGIMEKDYMLKDCYFYFSTSVVFDMIESTKSISYYEPIIELMINFVNSNE